MKNPRNLLIRGLLAVLIGLVVIGVLIALTSNFIYVFEVVDQDEVGIKFKSGQIVDVVGPGVYTDVGLYVLLRRVSSRGLPFSVTDEEIITSDKQRIGLVVTGDIFRPTLAKKDILLEKWAQYNGIFLEDALALTRVDALTKQAMKVCVGERKFDDAIIGTARDVLRNCIDEELSSLAENFGLEIQNVTVPNVVLSPEVQAALDSIVQSRLATEKAAQDKLKANAEAAAEQARQEGEIRAEQSRIQELAKQQTILAVLEQEKLQAQRAVIEAQKSNDLYSAQQDLQVNRALAAAAAEKAKATLANELVLAELYADYPSYLTLQLALANASALKTTDKIIFTLEGMMPTLVLPGPGIVPTVETSPIPN